eukprot:9467595-Pyramimonas_sp.AAC.1
MQFSCSRCSGVLSLFGFFAPLAFAFFALGGIACAGERAGRASAPIDGPWGLRRGSECPYISQCGKGGGVGEG